MVKIALLGDVMLGRLVNENLKIKPSQFVWGDTLEILNQADYRICNLECVISDRGNPLARPNKIFHFRSDQKNIAVLKNAEIDLVSIANNHVLDYEDEALVDMVYSLQKNNILSAGAGENIFDAEKPAMFKINDTSFACFAVTDNEPEWEATEDKPGVVYAPLDFGDGRTTHLLDRIDAVRNQVDCIIVSVHWGGNWGYEPPEEQKKFAKGLVNSGADIVFGHSPHVFRGIEIYQGKPIIYSAGDFVDDYAVDEVERNDQSFIFFLQIEPNKISKISLYPTIISNLQTNLATGEAAEEIFLQMATLCGELGTAVRKNPTENCLEISV